MNSEKGKYPVKYDLDCEGDGDFEYKGLTENRRCVYKKDSGRHQIWVRGEIPGIYLYDRSWSCPPCPDHALCELCIPEKDDSQLAVVSVDSWGKMPWKTMRAFAAGCQALEKLPEDAPDLRQVTDMSRMFLGASTFDQPLEKWDVSTVTHMSGLFEGATSFNQPLDQWNVARVADMTRMFLFAQAFSHYPKNWVVPEEKSEEMFNGTKVEAEARAFPLKKENKGSMRTRAPAGEGRRQSLIHRTMALALARYRDIVASIRRMCPLGASGTRSLGGLDAAIKPFCLIQEAGSFLRMLQRRCSKTRRLKQKPKNRRSRRSHSSEVGS